MSRKPLLKEQLNRFIKTKEETKVKILKKESHPVLCEFDEEFKEKKLYIRLKNYSYKKEISQTKVITAHNIYYNLNS